MLPFFVCHNFVVLFRAQNCNIRIIYFTILSYIFFIVNCHFIKIKLYKSLVVWM